MHAFAEAQDSVSLGKRGILMMVSDVLEEVLFDFPHVVRVCRLHCTCDHANAFSHLLCITHCNAMCRSKLTLRKIKSGAIKPFFLTLMHQHPHLDVRLKLTGTNHLPEVLFVSVRIDGV